jgi:hypothetical protein
VTTGDENEAWHFYSLGYWQDIIWQDIIWQDIIFGILWLSYWLLVFKSSVWWGKRRNFKLPGIRSFW